MDKAYVTIKAKAFQQVTGGIKHGNHFQEQENRINMKQEQNKNTDPRKKGERSHKQKKAIGNKVVGIYLAVLLLILGVLGTAIFVVYQSENISRQVAGIFEGTGQVLPEGENIPREEERTEADTAGNGEEESGVTVLSCEVLPDGTQFSLKGETKGVPDSDDRYLYLLEMDTYEDMIPEDASYIARTEKKTDSC